MRLRALALLAALTLVAACGEEPVEPVASTTPAPITGDQTGTTGGDLTAAQLQDQLVAVGDRVFFGFDSAQLTPEAQRTIEQQVSLIRRGPANTAIVVEGHADERGTREYNFALGDRRATAVANYMVALGVPSSRVSTISYGKERPADPRSNEEAWARNRRGVTVLRAGGAS